MLLTTVNVILALTVHCTGLLLDSLEYKNCSADLVSVLEIDHNLSHDGCAPWFTTENGECQPGPKLGGIIQQD